MLQGIRRFRVARYIFAVCVISVTVAWGLGVSGRLPWVHALGELHAGSQATPGPASKELKFVDTPPGVSVSNSRAVDIPAAEVQSTVVAPNKRAECPQGRLLISNDRKKQPGQIALLDLDNLDAVPTFAGIEALPSDDYRINSNDHDLLTLPGGDVLLLKMGQSRAPLSPEPAWFDYAYKLEYDDDILTDTWGPGARASIFVWRSVDCGDHFELVTPIDTATVDDGYGTLQDWSGGQPQFYKGPVTTAPGSPEHPIWSKEGTDGVLARVDSATGRVYVTIMMRSHLTDAKKPYFAVDKHAPLFRTVVVMSGDKGATWHTAAVLPFDAWRLDVVRRPNGHLAFGDSAGKTAPVDSIAFITDGFLSFQAPGVQGWYGWDNNPKDHSMAPYMGVGAFDDVILTRSPSSQDLLLAFADTIDGGKGDGFKLFRSHEAGFFELPDIAPQSPDPDNFILHATAIDPGSGPIFFYWYDVNSRTKAATIRGRLIKKDDDWTHDFGISQGGGVTRSFDVSVDPRWYGHYHTAGGYRQHQYTYHYYPVWVEPDGKVHFAHVELTMPHAPAVPSGGLGSHVPHVREWMERQKLDLSTLIFREPIEEEAYRRVPRR